MPHRLHALTPDALVMMDTIARSGSFAAAARELGKVPSALTYSVRQLEEALDVLLFDRSSRQAQLTPAGTELLHEGRRLLQEMAAVSSRVQRVAKGWEAELSISVEDILSVPTVFELVEAFCGLCDGRDGRGGRGGASGSGTVGDSGGHAADAGDDSRPGTRLRLRTDVLAGTWEALVSGQVDLAIGVKGDLPNPGGVQLSPLGDMPFVFCVAPHHALAGVEQALDDTVLLRQRAVAVADTAQRLTPITVGLLPGQDVLTVPNTRAKLEALLRGLGCGHLPEPLARPHLEAGHLVRKTTVQGDRVVRLSYAWRADHGRQSLGRALRWWLEQLESPTTRRALLERHAGPLD